MLKFVITLSAISLVALLGIAIDGLSTMKAQPTATPHDEVSIFAAGLVKGVTEEIDLRPQLAGRVVELLAHEGDLVKAGQVLLRVDDEQYRYELESASALVDRAKSELDRLINGARSEEKEEAKALMRARLADLEKATLDFNRNEQLWEESPGAITNQQLDDQRTKLASARAVVDAAKARVQLLTAPARQDDVAMAKAKWAEAKAQRSLANTHLKRTRLIAPRQGLVLKLNVEPGELAGPDSPTPALIMTDVSHLRVQAFVEELDAPRLKTGMPATITADGLPGKTYTGRVTRLSPRMQRKSLTTDDPAEHFDTKVREVWIDVAETPDFVIGLRVDVMIHSEDGDILPRASQTENRDS